MSILINIIFFLIFTKLFVFWLWLWQLKEYHFKRFIAHFETQTLRKIFFSFHGIRYPKTTNKILVLVVIGVIIEMVYLSYNPGVLSLIRSIILAPFYTSILVLLSNIPVKFFLKKDLILAEKKIAKMNNLTVIGITGSYGKTGVKEILSKILSSKFKTLKTEKNNNAEIGIARTILNELNDDHQIFIAEIGAYERGKIKEVTQMIKPRVGILTGINEQHLSTFGSLENIKSAKYELIDSLPKKGISIIKGNLEIKADNIVINKEDLSFDISGVNFKTNLIGRHNIDNILLATACALKLGMNLEDISRAVSQIKQGPMKIIKKDHLIILDSTYSSNPNGVIANLDYLNIYKGRKIIIMPCLIELGNKSREIHERIGNKINEVCDLAIITTKDYFEEIKQDREKIILIEDPRKVIEKISNVSTSGTNILLEGRLNRKIIEEYVKN